VAAVVSVIVAHDNRLGIGSTKINGLLWHIKTDFQHFKSITLGHPIIMGRKTFESIGKPLPNRENIIVTRNQNFSAFGCQIASDLIKAIELARTKDNQEIFIIGGGEIYRQAMEQQLVDRLYITHVQGDFQADIFFPNYSHFKLLKQKSGQEGNYQFTFKVYEKN